MGVKGSEITVRIGTGNDDNKSKASKCMRIRIAESQQGRMRLSVVSSRKLRSPESGCELSWEVRAYLACRCRGRGAFSGNGGRDGAGTGGGLAYRPAIA